MKKEDGKEGGAGKEEKKEREMGSKSAEAMELMKEALVMKLGEN